MKRSSLLTLGVIILAAAFARVIPHWPNFTPIMAMALVSGAVAGRKWFAYLAPLLAMAISDIVLGLLLGSAYAFHDTQVWVYASVLAISFLGRLFSNAKPTKLVFLGGTVAAVVFFIVTNAAVCFTGTMYSHTLQGLMQSYAAGLAFYRDGGNYLLNGIISTWAYGYAMMFALHLVGRRQAVAVKA